MATPDKKAAGRRHVDSRLLSRTVPRSTQRCLPAAERSNPPARQQAGVSRVLSPPSSLQRSPGLCAGKEGAGWRGPRRGCRKPSICKTHCSCEEKNGKAGCACAGRKPHCAPVMHVRGCRRGWAGVPSRADAPLPRTGHPGSSDPSPPGRPAPLPPGESLAGFGAKRPPSLGDVPPAARSGAETQQAGARGAQAQSEALVGQFRPPPTASFQDVIVVTRLRFPPSCPKDWETLTANTCQPLLLLVAVIAEVVCPMGT